MDKMIVRDHLGKRRRNITIDMEKSISYDRLGNDCQTGSTVAWCINGYFVSQTQGVSETGKIFK